MTVNGAPVSVVGIIPEGFNGFTVSADLWLPVRLTARIDPSPRWTERLDALVATVIARATPGMTLPRLERQLVAALPVVSATATDQALGARDQRGVGVVSLQEARRHPLVKPILQAIARTVRADNAPLSVAKAERLVDIVRAATSSTRFVATLLLGFAASAALLAGLGIYGVVSYIVSQRLREFGVRLVLGAEGRDLVLATLRRGVWLVGGGVAAGLVAASLGARLLGSFLYGIGTFDLMTDLAVVALVIALGMIATFIPARRITRIDPAAILKA